MITTIVFDIGNVLAHFGWKEYLKNCGYDEIVYDKMCKATVESTIWKEWDRSSLDEHELIQWCLKENPDIEKELKEFFEQVLSMVEEYEYSSELVKSLKENGYKVYVLSNYSRWHYEHDMETFHFLKHIDGGVVSYQVNYIKPEPQIYEALIEKYDIDPTQAVFIDDVQANLEGAKPFGFKTVLMHSYDQLLADLRGLEVII